MSFFYVLKCIAFFSAYAFTVNYNIGNLITAVGSDCKSYIVSFSYSHCSAGRNRTIFTCGSGYRKCIWSNRFERCVNSLRCLDIIECITVNRANTYTVYRNVFNFITLVRFNCKCLVITFIYLNSPGRVNRTIHTRCSCNSAVRCLYYIHHSSNFHSFSDFRSERKPFYIRIISAQS